MNLPLKNPGCRYCQFKIIKQYFVYLYRHANVKLLLIALVLFIIFILIVSSDFLRQEDVDVLRSSYNVLSERMN